MSVSRHRDAPRRAVARRRSASAFFAAALVLLCAVASAGTGLGGSVAALDDSTEVAGQGPDWPFRGIVRNVYSEPDGHPVLRFWSTETGQVRDVRLGPQTWCSLPLEVNAGTGVLATYAHSFARYFVPWGDEAYPVIRGPDFGHGAGENPGPGLDRSFLQGRLEMSDEGGRLRLATPREEAWSRTPKWRCRALRSTVWGEWHWCPTARTV